MQTPIEFPHQPPVISNDHWVVAEGANSSATIHLSGNTALCRLTVHDSCASGGPTVTNAPLLVTYQDPSGGSVVFTSFHNERQTNLSQNMEQILRFLIFQL
jgi:hypothetical protein